MTTIMLVDNGSRRADATLALRRISAALAQRLERPVHPVSLLHSSKVPAEALNGRPADILESFLSRKAVEGHSQFLAVPLFFGPSRALTKAIPETAAKVSAAGHPVQVAVADELCPLPIGEPRLAAILDRAIRTAIRGLNHPNLSRSSKHDAAPQAVLVDHGSPIPQVTAVRRWLTAELKTLARGDYRISEAAMERRSGPEYAFNGALLEEALAAIGHSEPQAQVVIGMQFIGPGRHAGKDGDVVSICQEAQKRFPGLGVSISGLVGEDEGLIDILADRATLALQACDRVSLPCSAA
ncbi:MAG: cobalamin biosynthesis protein CbiX [Lamprobacter sp.]|uniref:sirohydrochlorin chelatase n=1 Tax=Lamprobacter sp. TaxID=3100796 RepID=UPI002B258504|nr:cobalamin biosynthesis protein CbiX [Lamprobacter sp.]MEA3640154.1 cobalamin biosynthesis protein CbiX [Lamprobacter sp.]